MVSTTRKAVALIVLGVLAIVAIVIWANSGTAGQHSTARQTPIAAQEDSSDGAAPTLTELSLSAPGSRVDVGQSATFTVPGQHGETLYLRATMQEIQQLAEPDAQAARTAAGQQASTVVYQMPIELSFLGATEKGDGARKTNDHVTLSLEDLPQFTIATRPGENPLTNTESISTPGCQAQPQVSTQLHAGALITWCVHAFGAAGAPTPIGGSATAAAGPYQAPITWSSKKFKTTIAIP